MLAPAERATTSPGYEFLGRKVHRVAIAHPSSMHLDHGEDLFRERLPSRRFGE